MATTLADVKTVINQPAPAGEYASLRDKIRAEKTWRQDRYAAFERLLQLAAEAGKQAADEYDDKRPVPIGGAGFAWVTAYSDRTAVGRSFVIWAVKSAGWSKYYRGGVRVSIPFFDQNEGRKYAYAAAYAQTLREAGITAYPGSRLD